MRGKRHLKQRFSLKVVGTKTLYFRIAIHVFKGNQGHYMRTVSPLHKLLEHPDFEEGSHWKICKVKPNQVIFREGENGRSIYLILTGSVRLMGSLNLDDERRVQPGFSDLGIGEVFGELPLFDNQPRSASVIAVSECDLVEINSDSLISFLDQHPDVGYEVLKELYHMLVRRLRKANGKIFSLFAWGLKNCGITEHL